MRKQSKNIQEEHNKEAGKTASQDPFDALKDSRNINSTGSISMNNETNEINEDTALPDENLNVSQNGNTSFGNKKSRIRNVIDSESDEEPVNTETTVDQEDDGDGAKRPRGLSDSDTDKPTTKRSRIIDSDED